MQSVRQWLEQLGLPQYVEVFERNAVDLELLPELSDADLEKVGVDALGHRKKLLKAIAELNGGATSGATPRAVQDQLPAEQSPSAAAERRQLTVMFSDLVGSTELATKLDPEPLRDLMQAYQRTCREVIERYDGHIAQYLGDGLMVYFGWPRAHEDDAVRAIRAGLEAVEAVSKLDAATPLRARVGIHTGVVVVGETGQGDASIPKAAVGDTPNIAARLQALADPGSVMVSERTSLMARGLFDYADLGAQVLKGVAQPIRLFRVGAARAIDSRFEAARDELVLTPLVGREEEAALLLRRWQQAKEGEGQVVLMGGEPGIGKSRLARVLRERLRPEEYMALRFQCSPYHVNSALYPAIEQLERAAGFTREDSVEQKLDKMQAVLAGDERQVAQTAPLLAALLCLPIERYPALNLSPQRQKEETLEALASQVEALAKRQPVLMIYEDVHWMDATTQETLDLLVPRLRDLPVLLLITYRPEYTPRWSDQAHVTILGLNRLGRRQGVELATRIAAGKSLPQEVLEQILNHTDGIPLFIEELTKSVLESKLLRETDDCYVLDTPLPALAIPTTLRDSLIARLDRLAPVREVAQIGACIGREFAYELLAAVSQLKGKQLEEALEQVTKTGLVFRRGTPPEATYTFKHALVQDAAYDSLLKSKRAQLHAQIAKVLEEDFSDRIANEPELLAHHLSAAGAAAAAIPHWHKAGQRASQRLAYTEAIAYFQRGIELAHSLPDSPEVAGLEVGLQLGLGYAYLPTKGYTAPESLKAFTRAQALCKQAGASKSIFDALRGLWLFELIRGEVRTALSLADECLKFAQAAQAREMLMEGHFACGLSFQRLGDWRAARRHLEQSLALYDPVADRSHAIVYGQDSKLGALAWLALVLGALGYPDQALSRSAEAEVAAPAVTHPFSQCFAYHAGFFVHSLRGEADRARAQAEALIAVAKDQGFPFFELVGVGFRSLAVLQSGQGGVNEIGELRNVIAAFLGLGAGEPALRMRSFLAQGFAYLPDVDAGLRECEEALKLTLQHDHREFEAILLRVQGDLLSMEGRDLNRAADSYRKSIEVANGQHARSFELAAALGLARLHCRRGEYEYARAVLAPVYNWFTEGFDTKDLKQAKALLEELAQ